MRAQMLSEVRASQFVYQLVHVLPTWLLEECASVFTPIITDIVKVFHLSSVPSYSQRICSVHFSKTIYIL